MSETLSSTPSERLTPLLFSPGITDVIPPDLVQRFVYLKTGLPGSIDYTRLRDTVAPLGYELIMYQPDWSATPPHQWADDMAGAGQWLAAPGEPLVLAGFSFGGLLAAQAAEKLQALGADAPHVLGVAALSLTCLFGQHFREAMKKFPEDEESLLALREDGKPKLHPDAFAEMREILLPDIGDCPAQVYVGELEPDIMQEVAVLATHRWQNAERIVVPGGGHDIAKRQDLTAIAENLGAFLRG